MHETNTTQTATRRAATRRAEWPGHSRVERPWRTSARRPRSERVTSVVASVPPWIADRAYTPASADRPLLDRAAAAVRTLDAEHGARLVGLETLLTRTEAVASSRIEDEHASFDDYARAVAGVRANPSATTMVDATLAIRSLVHAVDGTEPLSHAALHRAHALLMRHDVTERPHAGRYRDVQNWIGGGSGPANARYVPPPPDLVPPLMDDLLRFLARDDLHPIAQAAIGHAQFESIHPFTDGNGRIGRALVAAVLRRRGLAGSVIVPVAAALVVDRAAYFHHLERYRFGSVHDFVAALASAIGTACDEAMTTSLLLAELDGAASSTRMLDDPVLLESAADELARQAGTSTDALVAPLVRDGLLRPVTDRRRDRAWIVPSVAAELDAFAERVHDALRVADGSGRAAAVRA